jgi:hypothetical protein
MTVTWLPAPTEAALRTAAPQLPLPEVVAASRNPVMLVRVLRPVGVSFGS